MVKPIDWGGLLGPYLQPLKERLGMLPLGQYEDGSVRPAWPGMLTDALSRGMAAAETPIPAVNDDAAWAQKSAGMFDAASLAPLGGLGVGALTGFADNAVGSAGAKLGQAASELPMDLASRMARAKEMGFDTETPLYHGTRGDFDELARSTEQMSDFTQGVYAARDPSFANGYGTGEGGRVLPLYARGKMMQPDEYRDLYSQYWVGSDGKPSPASIKGGPSQQEWIEAEARKRGYSGIFAGGRDGTTVVFEPSDLRSVNAAFDPSKSDSANLLAANAAPGSLPSLAAQTQEQDGQTLTTANILRLLMGGNQ